MQKKVSRREWTASVIPLTAIRDCAVATTAKIEGVIPPERRTYLYNQVFPASRERATQASISSRATSRNQVSAQHSDSKWKPRQAHLLTTITWISTQEAKGQTARTTGCGGHTQTAFSTYLDCVDHPLAQSLLCSQMDASS